MIAIGTLVKLSAVKPYAHLAKLKCLVTGNPVERIEPAGITIKCVDGELIVDGYIFSQEVLTHVNDTPVATVAEARKAFRSGENFLRVRNTYFNKERTAPLMLSTRTYYPLCVMEHPAFSGYAKNELMGTTLTMREDILLPCAK